MKNLVALLFAGMMGISLAQQASSTKASVEIEYLMIANNLIIGNADFGMWYVGSEYGHTEKSKNLCDLLAKHTPIKTEECVSKGALYTLGKGGWRSLSAKPLQMYDVDENEPAWFFFKETFVK